VHLLAGLQHAYGDRHAYDDAHFGGRWAAAADAAGRALRAEAENNRRY
jgi:hypothetical protein